MRPIPSVPGTNDVLPAQSAAWQWLLETHARVAQAHGYQLIDTPVIEYTELFERGIGTGTDVVAKEMYTFADRGGRSLTLRPEGTAGVLRACLASGLVQERRPLRVRYEGPMFRGERPQKGRYRQFSQVGVECIGEAAAALDAEVIEMGWRFLEALGLSGVSLQVNTLGDSDDRARYRAALLAYFTPIRDQLCDDCRRRLDTNPMRILDCKRDAALTAGAPDITASLSEASVQSFGAVLAHLDDARIPYAVNRRLVRGLDYYAHTAFELWHTSLEGAQNALGGGGRYDGLAELLGFAATPGVGYAFGVERLLIIADQLGTAPVAAPAADAVVCSLNENEAAYAAAVARSLRDHGLTTVLDAGSRRIDRKLRAADRLGAVACLIVGPDEAGDGSVQVKDLRSGAQERHPLAIAADAVRRLLAGEAEPVA